MFSLLQRRHERGGVYTESPGAAGRAEAGWRHPGVAADLQLRPCTAVGDTEGGVTDYTAQRNIAHARFAHLPAPQGPPTHLTFSAASFLASCDRVYIWIDICDIASSLVGVGGRARECAKGAGHLVQAGRRKWSGAGGDWDHL